MTGHTILLADNDRLIQATLGDCLRNAGYDVRVVCDGEAALRVCDEITPDLAVLDINIPKMNGIKVAHHLRENTSVPFIFLSAYGDDDIVGVAVDEGAQGFMVKPVDVIQLLPMIKAAIARATDFHKAEENQSHLNTALANSRETSVAIGLIMERYHLGHQDAFEALRFHARSQRQKLSKVAAEMLEAANRINLPSTVLGKVKNIHL